MLIVISAFVLLAVWFARHLVHRDQGESEPVRALWLVFLLGFLGMIIAGMLENRLIPDVLNRQLPTGTLVWAALGIGIIEEACKCALPIAYLYRKRYFNEHTDGVIYFAIAGLGFGVPENIMYTLQFGAGAGAVRLFMTPLFHAAATGMVGYAVARTKVAGAPAGRVWAVLAAVALLHGAYDFGLLSRQPLFILMSLVITTALTIGVFLLFRQARYQDQLRGLSVVGNNSFCRSCGYPNPRHHLYCSRCGKHA